MRIERLKLTNFRNYSNLDIKLSSNINLFIGDNAQGKTNILESIYLLSLTKSNRYGNEDNLIKFNEEIAKIEGMIYGDFPIRKQEIHLTKTKKQLFINNKEIRRNRDYISNFCVIAFTPDDLEIVKGSPNARRNMLNIDISQLHNNYIAYLNEYNQVIKIRNEYLKKMNLNGNTDERYLEVINSKMIENAIIIYQFRFEFFNKVNELVSKIFKKITGISNLTIKYHNSLNIDTFDKEIIRKKYQNKINKNLNIELMQGMTLTGPHRDDFSFDLNGIDMKSFASQGQQRMAIVALKLSEIYLFKKEYGEYPVLLLDDIFSEIDNKKRQRIIKYLQNDIQSIITTTDVNDISSEILESATIYNVKSGKVTKKGRINNGR